MFAKIKSPMFIDGFRLELSGSKGNCLRGILRDDKGSICSTIEKNIAIDSYKNFGRDCALFVLENGGREIMIQIRKDLNK